VQANETYPFRLLIVDDIDDNRTILRRRFAKSGYTIVEAGNGFTALELIAQQSFDLVLLDIMMPGIDGLEILRQIRVDWSPDELPVIMVTAKADTADVIEALRLGANDYLTKPVNFSIAHARAHAQLSRKRANDALNISLRELEKSNRRLTIEIDERKRSEDLVNHLRCHDPLTSLFNRKHFLTELERELKLRSRRNGSLAIFLLDLDGFELINNTLGVGDRVLTTVAARLRDCVREVDVIGRVGSDEFGIVAVVAGPDQADQLADRIVAALAEPHAIDGDSFTLTASIGIAIAPNDGTEADLLIRNAQLALSRAKSEGSARRRFFQTEMNARAQARRQLESDLRKALSGGEFEVFYQPFFDLGSHAVSGCEALLRWRHPKRGLVSPADFIPLAEETGLIVPLGSWVLRQACADAATWPSQLKIAVNVSSVQFRNRGLLASVMSALTETGLPAQRLELEITESVLLDEDSITLEMLHHLRQIGICISLDDFGTGFSSLSYLRAFPFDKIKIDRSFVSEIGSSQKTTAIMNSLINLASGLEMSITAEGVETQAQCDWLRLAGCTEAQGYLISRPLPAPHLRSFLDLNFRTSQVA
jgi:diguanylate cyclase (GGDEF)-like protein